MSRNVLNSAVEGHTPEVAQGARSGEVCVVTGGQQGLGYCIAERLAKEGARVVLLDLNAQKLQEAAARIGANASFRVMNVTDEKNVAGVFQSILDEFGKIDVLVQAAGVTGKTGIKTHDVDPANFDFVMNVNLRGIFLCCKYTLPSMLQRNYGRIVNIASVAGKEGNAGMLAYSASKAGVIGLTKVIGKEFAETGITVNCLAPAVIRTAMVAAMPDQQVKYMTDKIPMKRCGSLDEIATMVSFIASRGASFTTAFCFDATGGRATY
jgi:3-oxoacyl-[acyl-carrier protein] reductase